MRRAPLLVASLLSALLAVLAGPAAGDVPAPAQRELPGLVATGASEDGWERYALPGPALPQALPEGEALRAEVHFLQGGLPRAFRVLVPVGASRPAPVVVSLHGLHESVDAADRAQQWGPVVRAKGAVLVQGIGHDASWNAGACCGTARDERVDDVRYLDQVLAVVGALHPLDPRRVHVTGFSNGAMMAYRWACERPQVVAGVLAVAGTVTSPCRDRVDVAVLHVHGLRDRTVPVEGTAWSRVLGTPLRPVSRTTTWFGPRITAQLLRGFGHGWPTRARGGYATTASGWAWLAAHPRPAD